MNSRTRSVSMGRGWCHSAWGAARRFAEAVDEGRTSLLGTGPNKPLIHLGLADTLSRSLPGFTVHGGSTAAHERAQALVRPLDRNSPSLHRFPFIRGTVEP